MILLITILTMAFTKLVCDKQSVYEEELDKLFNALIK